MLTELSTAVVATSGKAQIEQLPPETHDSSWAFVATELAIIALLLVACGWIGGSMMKSKGRGFASGFTLGLFLGPLGLIICAILKADHATLDKAQPDQAV